MYYLIELMGLFPTLAELDELRWGTMFKPIWFWRGGCFWCDEVWG